MSLGRCAGTGLRLAAFLLMLLGSALAIAATALRSYRLQPIQVAEGSYVFVGEREDFSTDNGGNIVNTAFVVTGDGVIVIDTGPTRKYGEAMRAAISRVTEQPIREVWITHHHPDHFLGNQAYTDVPIRALAPTATGMRDDGQAFASNVYRLTGDWAKGTEPVPATSILAAGIRQIGTHRFRLLALEGHTAADLAIFDETTGVLYAGDLAFHDRAPTTPHADVSHWLASLDQLAALPLRVLVPGHGPPAADARAISQTRAWLKWLDATLRQSAVAGLDATEVSQRPLPEVFAGVALARQELTRSIAHLYRQMESDALHQPAETKR